MPAKKTPLRDIRWVAEMNDNYLLCRSLRHQWDPSGRFRGLTKEEREALRSTGGFTQLLKMTLECRRCDAVRVDLYGRSTAGKLNGGSFTKLRAGYDYPKGYTFDRKDHAADRPNNSDYYKELFARYGKAE